MPQTISIAAFTALAAGLAIGIAIGAWLQKKRNRIRRGAIVIDRSTVAGRGAFAAKPIHRGEILERCPAIEVTDKDVGGTLLDYVFYGSAEDRRLVAMGYGMLFNHSSTPNVAYYREESPIGTELIIYALRDVRSGEELFYDYGPDWWNTRR